MKFTTRLHCLAAAVCGALLPVTASAQTPVPAAEASKHFAAVAKHLELGGHLFSYMDVDGDLAALGKLGDRFLNLAREHESGIPKELSAGKIIEALGLNSVKAVGLSSRAAGQGLFHNRALLHMPDGPKGLLKLFGGKAAPFEIAQWAPADAGIAFQMDLTLGALAQTIEAVIEATGQDSALAQYKFALTMPIPGLNLTAGDLLGKLNTRVMFVLRLDESKQLQFPGSPIEVPGFQAMLALDSVDFLFEPLLAVMENDDNVVIEKDGALTTVRPNSALPGDLDYYKPGFLFDSAAKRLVLTSHLDMARTAGKGKALATSPDFQKAMTGLPAEGNGLSYATPQCLKTLSGLFTKVMGESAKAAGGNPAVEEAMQMVLELFTDVPAAPVASVHALVPEGMLFVSNDTGSHKSTLLMPASFPVMAMVAAGAYSGYQALLPKVRARAAERAEQAAPAEEPSEDAAPDKAVKNNLQQIAFSAQTWFIDHPRDKEVTYETLVKNDLLFELDPVAGETYKGLTLKRGGGELSVKLKSGGSVAHKYQAVTE